MAWIDDRLSNHPKVADISDAAFRVWIYGIGYSSGYGTGGTLSPGQRKTLGSSPAIQRELVRARLWDDIGDGNVRIHDWDEHNGARDRRKAADRERKRNLRHQQYGNPHVRPQDSPQDSSADSPPEDPQEPPEDAPRSRRTLTVDGRQKKENPPSVPNRTSPPNPATANGQHSPRTERTDELETLGQALTSTDIWSDEP